MPDDDDAAPPSPTPSPSLEEILASDETRDAVVAVVTRLGVPEQDRIDVFHEVVVDVLAWDGDKPTTTEKVIALCVTIAHDKGVSRLRKAKAHGGARGELTADADEHAAANAGTYFGLDPVDQRRVLDEVKKLPPKVIETLHDIGAGVNQRTLSVDDDVPYQQVRKTTERGRTSTRARVAAAGLAILFVAGIALVVVRRQGDGLPAHPAPRLTPAQVQAEQLRDQAAERCAARDYDTCLRLYVRAQTLDPEENAAVAAAHDEAAARYRELVDDASAVAGPDGAPPVRPHPSAKPAGSGAPKGP